MLTDSVNMEHIKNAIVSCQRIPKIFARKEDVKQLILLDIKSFKSTKGETSNETQRKKKITQKSIFLSDILNKIFLLHALKSMYFFSIILALQYQTL